MGEEARLLEEALGSEAYIQVNKKLIRELGLHEAIMIAELLSERKYWRIHNRLTDDNWFYSTRENLENNTGLTPYYQREAIQSLVNAGILLTKKMGLPAKVYYSVVDGKLLKALTTCEETVLQQDDEGFNDINKNIEIKINNKNKIISTGAGALTKKHSQVYKKKETLIDDLQSGKDIDEQKAVKKKSNIYDNCLAQIISRYDGEVCRKLQEHLEWSYHSKDPKRIKTVKSYIKRLDDFDKLEGDKVKIIQQSIDKQWHCFYELQTSNKVWGNTVDNSTIQRQKLSAEEAKRVLAGYAERNGVI